MKRNGGCAAIRVTVLSVGSPLAHNFETQAAEDTAYFIRLENRNIPHYTPTAMF